jgi:hypothetical protein
MSPSFLPLTLDFFLIHSRAGRARETQMAEDPGIENEPRLHAARHRAVHDIVARMDRISRAYPSTRFAPGVAPVFVSGAEAELERRQRTDGAPLNEVIVQGLCAAAGLGVEASALR